MALQESLVHEKTSGSGENHLLLLEHDPVYTMGRMKDETSLGDVNNLPHPVQRTNRGGQATYHGPGQSIVYVLIDLKRKAINVRQLVNSMENAVVALLSEANINALARADAPGVYVQDKKIASVGLRLKKECCYHGISLNVDMDLSPFSAIDPCGYRGLEVTQLKDLGILLSQAEAAEKLLKYLAKELGYSD